MSTSKAVYRNSSGCCICRTKSSSSRFTQSRRYENTFEECFRVSSKERSGFICNSCVLIVKRFRKNTNKLSGVKDWSHKIDSRVGPGSKPKSHRKTSASAAVSAASSRNSSPPRSISKATGKLAARNTSSRTAVRRETVSMREAVLRKMCDKRVDARGSVRRKAYTARRRCDVTLDLDLHAFIDPIYFKRSLAECCGEQYRGSHGDILAALQPCSISSSSSNLPCSLSWTTLLIPPTPEPSDTPLSASPPTPDPSDTAISASPATHEVEEDEGLRSVNSEPSQSADIGNTVSEMLVETGITALITPRDTDTGLLTPADGLSVEEERVGDRTTRLLTEVSACLSVLDEEYNDGNL